MYGIVHIVWLSMAPAYEKKKKVGVLMASGLFQRASISSLIQLAMDIDFSCHILLRRDNRYIHAQG